jgi:hypothetical protein
MTHLIEKGHGWFASPAMQFAASAQRAILKKICPTGSLREGVCGINLAEWLQGQTTGRGSSP